MSLLELHTRSLELAADLVDTVQPEQLVLPTPCTGWSLRRSATRARPSGSPPRCRSRRAR
ncbi:hypothetical protein ACWC5I_37180 [Kitasatospora sp. NPDC001574]